MGHSKAEKAENHARIVGIAAARLREAGLDGVSVADLMKEAGLTVGGFYKHFGSRDDLVLEALEAAKQPGKSGGAESDADPSFAAFVDRYLSEAHRDARGGGCVLCALMGDAARSGAATKAFFTRRIEDDLGSMIERLAGRETAGRRAGSIVALSAMVGALGLARATSDDALSREILATVRQFLKETLQDRS